MKIGERVLYEGKVYVLRGFDPMGVTGRRAQLEDVRTRAVVQGPLERVRDLPEGRAQVGREGPGGRPAADRPFT